MMVKTTTMEYLFFVLLDKEGLKRMVEGSVEEAITPESQPKDHQYQPMVPLLGRKTEDLRSVSPTPSFKEAKMSVAYYQPHPDNETTPIRSHPPAWKYEVGQNMDTSYGDGKFDSLWTESSTPQWMGSSIRRYKASHQSLSTWVVVLVTQPQRQRHLLYESYHLLQRAKCSRANLLGDLLGDLLSAFH